MCSHIKLPWWQKLSQTTFSIKQTSWESIKNWTQLKPGAKWEQNQIFAYQTTCIVTYVSMVMPMHFVAPCSEYATASSTLAEVCPDKASCRFRIK